MYYSRLRGVLREKQMTPSYLENKLALYPGTISACFRGTKIIDDALKQKISTFLRFEECDLFPKQKANFDVIVQIRNFLENEANVVSAEEALQTIRDIIEWN